MRIPAFLLLLLISILWESGAYGRGSTQTWVPATTSAPSCTLDVVLVTFDDATMLAGGYDYHLHDRPYGTNPGEQLTDRYTLRDFERLFIGGYDSLPDFVDTTQTVANGDTLVVWVGGLSGGGIEITVRNVSELKRISVESGDFTGISAPGGPAKWGLYG